MVIIKVLTFSRPEVSDCKQESESNCDGAEDGAEEKDYDNLEQGPKAYVGQQAFYGFSHP